MNGFVFTLISTTSQTARIAPITGGSITGNITLERFVPGPTSGWATICTPITGRTLADWNDDLATSGFIGSTYGTGTFISIYGYDETVAGLATATASYTAATNVTNSLDPLKGYYVYVADVGAVVADKLIDVTGPPATGTKNMGVTFTASGGVDEDGWNLIANPYPSAIDWSSPNWTKTNMDNAIYIYNTDIDQYVGFSGDTIGGAFNGGNEIIGSSQAFFVHANAASPVLIASEDVKDASNPSFFKPMKTSAAAGVLRLQLDGLNGTYTDETVFRTRVGATTNFDPAYDAYKLYSFNPAAPNISSKLNGTEYVVNAVDELTANFDLPVRVNVNTPGSYTINFIGLQNFASVSCFTFEDKLTGTFTNLHVDTSYTFTSALDTASANPRFVLHFGLDPLAASLVPSATTVSIPGNALVSFTNTSSGASFYSWDFGDGSPVETAANPTHTYTAAGVYTVTLTASNAAGCSGPQTTTVQITVDDVTAVTTIANAENIVVTNDAQGVYASYNFKNNTKVKVNIYNALGEKLGDTQINTVQNKGRFEIEKAELAKGIYTVELLFNNRKISKKIEL